MPQSEACDLNNHWFWRYEMRYFEILHRQFIVFSFESDFSTETVWWKKQNHQNWIEISFKNQAIFYIFSNWREHLSQFGMENFFQFFKNFPKVRKLFPICLFPRVQWDKGKLFRLVASLCWHKDAYSKLYSSLFTNNEVIFSQSPWFWLLPSNT